MSGTMVVEKILIVDDEPEAIENCRRILSLHRYECVAEADARRALDVIERERPQVLLTDIRMPGLDGIELLKAAKRIDPAIKVVLVTAYASLQTAVESMRFGAFDYLAKPFTGKELRGVIRRALGQEAGQANEPASPVSPSFSRVGEIVAAEPVLAGESSSISAVRDVIERIANTEAAVWLSGERGTGKERIARVIHAGSHRRAKHFVSVDCQASDEALIEWELFGGPASQSVRGGGDRTGLLESVDGGTLFLDGVESLSLRLQAKLLRVLKERQGRRGNGEFYPLDVRVVSASSRDLRRACHAGEFRDDLYHYLSIVPIVVSPLRQRTEDINPLSRRFMDPLWLRKHRTLPPVFGFTPEALARLRGYAWPGNVQELQRVVERAVVLAGGPVIDSSYLPDNIQSL